MLGFELLADDLADGLPRGESDTASAEPDANDPAKQERAQHRPLNLLAVEVPLFPVLDVAVLADALHVGEARVDPVRGAHVPVGTIVEVADVEVHAVVPQPREQAVALRYYAGFACSLLDGLDRDEEVETLDDLLPLERRERRRADDLASVVEDRTTAVALDDGGVGLDDALAADVLLEARDAAGRDRGLVLRGAAQELVGGDDARKADDEERLPQMQVRAVPGQTDDRQLLVLDLQNRHIAAVLLAGLARGIRARTDDDVGGRAVEVHLRGVGLVIGKMDLKRPLEREPAAVLRACGERMDALSSRSVGQAVQLGDTG